MYFSSFNMHDHQLVCVHLVRVSAITKPLLGALMCSMGAREWVLCHDMNILRPTMVTTWYHVYILLVFLIVTSETGHMVDDGNVLCNEAHDMMWAGGDGDGLW